jgi:hypothetical protein
MDRRWILAPIALWMALLFLVQVFGAFAAPDSSVMPDACPEDSQNCARATIGFDATPADVMAAALAWEDPSVVVVDGNSAHVVHHTRWLNYPDDMFLEADCNENGTWLNIQSQSRLGVSDLGVNQDRIDGLLAHLASIDFEAAEC